MFIIYDILFTIFALAYTPYLLIRRKWHEGYKIRFGSLPLEFIEKVRNQKCIWIHAVSVGEILVIADLIKQIKNHYEHHTIICSTVTKTGYQIANQQLKGECEIIYAPVDYSWIVKKFIRIINPAMYISAETEIWPNLYTALRKAGVPIVLVNGRISDKAFRGYKRFKFLLGSVLSGINRCSMQSELDADRIKQLGVPPERVTVTGNLKFDQWPDIVDIQKVDLGFRETDELVIAGSTHPGEEEILVDVYDRLINDFMNLRLVIAPRHVDRVGDVVSLIERRGYRPVLFSKIHGDSISQKTIVIIDTIGQLRRLYSLATIVFIGKTLTVGGGQNMIEPAYFGKPTIVGPLTANFKDIVSLFKRTNAMVQVADKEELLTQMQKLLTEPDAAKKIGLAAQSTIKENQGALTKTIEELKGILVRT